MPKAQKWNFAEGRESNSHNIKEWLKSGVVKTLKLHVVDDGRACDNCKKAGIIYELSNPDEKHFVIENPSVNNCTNPTCRCYWRPEKIEL